jgi:glutamine amidotransferase
MCRLFGFRSVINSQVHSSLVHADNALSSQSIKHPDGWGVAYYREDTPHLIKSTERAFDDHIFHKVSGVVSSDTVVAHLRKATQGNLSILNSHPFQYGTGVFAHTGNLKTFDRYKSKLISRIDPELQKFVLGSTDSEIIFYLLLTFIKKRQALSDINIHLGKLKDATEELCHFICQYSGPLYGGETSNPKENHLTFILTSGKVMIGFQGGQHLNFSSHKSLCSERETCSYYSKICEHPTKNNEQVNHLIFSSEKLVGENIWQKMERGELIGVDSNMYLTRFKLNVHFT